MATLHVRNAPDALYDRLRLRAAAEHRSLSAEVIGLLESGLGASDRGAKMDEVLARL
jgi:plasmid stability protein